MWSIEPAEKNDTADTPRSLWDRVQSQLRPPEDQNDRRSTRLAARPVMSPGLERTFLEAHLRLLLGKLGVSNANRTTKEGSCCVPAKGYGTVCFCGVGNRAPGRCTLTCAWKCCFSSRRSTRHACHHAHPPSTSVSSFKYFVFLSSAAVYAIHRAPKQTSSRAPTTPWVPLETQEDRAVYDFLSASSANGADGRDGCKRSSAGKGLEDGTFGAGGSGSRPGTSRRPGSSRSARSAPECLESGRSLTVATIDTALGELRAAFDEEAENLMGEVADLTGLLEHEATRKATVERRSRQSMSTLRRYGKKLEEAVRSQEHAADVLERLALPRRRSPGEPTGSEAAAHGRKGRGRRGDGAAAVAQAPRSNGKADIGRRSVGDPLTPSPPSFKGVPDPAGSTSLNRRGPEGRRRGSNRRASGGDGVSGSGRTLLAVRLHGAVRVSREEDAFDDERFWS
ncbi:unnamed protein product [Scytosiphon promiscuus]